MERINIQFAEHIDAFLDRVSSFIPHLLIILMVLVAGFLIAYVTSFIVSRLLKTFKFDNWSDEVGITGTLKNARITITPTNFVSALLFWIVFAIFFMLGFASLGLNVTNTLVSLFFLYLPRFISAIFIFFFGYFIAGFLARAALLAGVNAGIEYSRLLSNAIRLLILIFVFAMAFEQLSIAPKIVYAAFSIFFGSISLALAIAFGLGGRDAAKRFIEGVKKKRERDETEPL
ncbi:MAG: hypothetical protein HYS21_00370 [Deltaproteobacteria bacterium]|nr:hypothetical protein [Deltaproteobacteria bacterium]